MFQGRRQGRAHEPIREFRTAETQSLSPLDLTEDGRVHEWSSLARPTRNHCAIEWSRSYSSDRLLQLHWPSRTDSVSNRVTSRRYALIHGFTTASQTWSYVRDGRAQTAAMHHCASTSYSSSKILYVSSKATTHPTGGVQSRQYTGYPLGRYLQARDSKPTPRVTRVHKLD